MAFQTEFDVLLIWYCVGENNDNFINYTNIKQFCQNIPLNFTAVLKVKTKHLGQFINRTA